MSVSLSFVLLIYTLGAAVLLCALLLLLCQRGCSSSRKVLFSALVLVWGGSALVLLEMLGDEYLSSRALIYSVVALMLLLLGVIRFSVGGAHRQQSKDAALAQQALSSAEDTVRTLQAVVEAVPDAVLKVNAQGLITDCSPIAERMFACGRDSLLKRPLVSLFVPAENISTAPALIWPFVDPAAWAGVLGVRTDGSVFSVAVTAAPLAVGAELSVLFLHDITAQVQQQRLDRFERLLNEKIHRSVGKLGFLRELGADLQREFSFPVVMLYGAQQAGLGQETHATLLSHLTQALPSSVLAGFHREMDQDGNLVSQVLHSGHSVVLSAATHQSHPILQCLSESINWLAALPLHRNGQVKAVLLVAGRSSQAQAPLFLEPLVGLLSSAWQLVANQEWLHLQSTAMLAAANAMFITDREGHIEWVNAAFTHLSGFSEQEMLGNKPSLLKSGIHNGEHYQRLWDTILAKEVWHGEVVERRKDGTLYTVDQTITPIVDEHGTITHFVAVHEDITERKKAEERIAYLSNYDTLTRLPNRVLFRDNLYQAVTKARHERLALAVMFIDLDRFSRVNDTLGHDVGDQLLMTIASRINATAAPYADTIARIGGDEFAIIQSHLPTAETAATLAHKVIDAINAPIDLSGLEVSVGANVGIAIFPQDGDDPDHLIKNADMAMYRAIRSETESCFFFSNEMNAEARIRLSLEGDLRKALDHGDLSLYFQPQINTQTRKVVGVEALLRWNHPELGPVSPARFIPVAEDSGLILPIGDWVLEESMRQSRVWLDAGLPSVTMAINISAVQFRQSSLVRKVHDTMQAAGLDPARVELELTESMLMQDAREAVLVLHQLSELGAMLAIDDFGTGYSSLSYLKKFPVDKLKLDQSFVRHMTTDNNDAVIARATINLGHSLGLHVIAEGVETIDQFWYLHQEGCDEVQGYLFGKPMTPTALAELLAAQQDDPEGNVFHALLAGGAPSQPRP